MPRRLCAPAHLAAAAVTAAALALAPSSARAALFDFEDQPIGVQTPFTAVADGLGATFSGPPGVDPGAFQVSYNSSSGPLGPPYRTLTDAFLTVGTAFGAAGSSLTIAFSAPLSAISLDFALDDPSGAASLALATSASGAASAQGTLAAGFRDPEGVLSFAGAPFTSLTLSSGALDFQLDNVAATLAAPVPEPASLATLGAGLAALAAASPRRRRGPARS